MTVHRVPLPSLISTLDVVAAIALAAALAGWLVGGTGIHVGPWTLPVRDAWRPLLVVMVALALSYRQRRGPGRTPPALEWLLGVGLLGGSLTAVLIWSHYQVRFCGGADSYGYLSAARAIATGTVVQPQPIVASLPFADGIAAATPFGWTPKGADALVPFYPLGLPLVMAAFMAVGGVGAGFYAPLAIGILLLILTYRLTRSFSEPVVAAAITMTVAFSPMVTNMVVQPMSDVPAAFWFLATLAALLASPPRAVLAGLAFGMAVWTRPLLLVTAPALLLVTGFNRGTLSRFCAGAVPVVAAIAVTQRWLYGSPLRTGYGSASGLFTTANLTANAWAYAKWVVMTHSPAFVVALGVGVWLAPPRLARAALAGLALGVAPYLFKLAYFDDWDLVRYVLPVLVPCLIVGGLGVAGLLQRWLPRRGALLLLALFAVVASAGSYQFVANRATFRLIYQESRYAMVADWIRGHTPAAAVVFAEGHSGSLRFYADRTTLRTDLVPAGALAETVRRLRRDGHESFAVVDGDEEARSFERGVQSVRGVLRADPINRIREAVIYRLEVP